VKKDVLSKLHSNFEDMVNRDPDTGTEFWLARDLQEPLGYAKWDNLAKVIEKAKTSCRTAGYDPLDHFRDVRKMISLGSGAQK
jgi:DNA-damage-inducible protein D